LPPQSTQSAGPVRFLIFCSISISLLASLVAGTVEDPSVLLGHCSRECTPPYLSTGISNLLQPVQADVVLGHLSIYLASWVATPCSVHNILRLLTSTYALCSYRKDFVMSVLKIQQMICGWFNPVFHSLGRRAYWRPTRASSET
jgi:hypothetical protein